MPIPAFVAELRRHVGHAPLWLSGATAVVLREDDHHATQVLLVRRSDTGGYAPISGIVDPREHPADTLVREAYEEARVRIAVDRLVAVRVVPDVVYPNGDVTSYLDHTYRCTWLSGDPHVGDDEATEVGWWPVTDLPPMAGEQRRPIDIVLDDPREVVHE